VNGVFFSSVMVFQVLWWRRFLLRGAIVTKKGRPYTCKMQPNGFKLSEIGAGQTHSRHNHYQITASLDEGSFRGPSGLCIIRLPAGC
jgi:hypothetical protein